MVKFYTRKNNRLKHCDYTLNGYYYVTICTDGRKEWLGNVINDQIQINLYGRICQQTWLDLPTHYNNLSIDTFILMPNHIHGILIIDNFNKRVNPRGRVTNPPLQVNNNKSYSLSEIIRGFKTFSSKQINITIKTGNKFKWQRSFHDHIIRNDKSLNNIREYIINNPAAWAEDENNVNIHVGTGLQPVRYPNEKKISI
ncbi:MAG: transposase [Candidatus Omnitrophota bacterium]